MPGIPNATFNPRSCAAASTLTMPFDLITDYEKNDQLISST